MVFGWIEWPDKATRDAAWGARMQDGRGRSSAGGQLTRHESPGRRARALDAVDGPSSNPERPMRRVALLLSLAACGGPAVDELPTEIPAPCDPLDPSVCALPWPSSHFLVTADTPTGRRVAFDETSLPINFDGVRTLPASWNTRDGFSINSAMLFYMDDVDLTVGGLPTPQDIGAYADADARIVVLDATTGERHPIWVEADATAPSDDMRLVTIRPATPFAWDHTYVVGVRGMVDHDGASIPASTAFAALRDGTSHDDPSVQTRRAHFDDVVFPALEADGLARDTLQLAWDFHTASRENTLGNQEWIRDDALAWVEAQGGLQATIDTTEDFDCDAEGTHIWRELRGTFEVPLYLQSDAPEDNEDSVVQGAFARDADGHVRRNGTTTADFVVRIPCSVGRGRDGADPVPSPVVQWGHGLFGSKEDARSGWLAELADRGGFSVFAMDWTGLSGADFVPIAFMMASTRQDKLNPTDFAMVPERTGQGIVESLLGTRLVKTTLGDDPKMQSEGRRLIDPDRVWFYGESAGAILGSALIAMSPDLDRGLMVGGGGPFSLLLPRSRNFDQFFLLLKNKYADHRDVTLFVAGLTQQLWDPAEVGGWSWDMAADDSKAILQQVSIYDNQVPTLGAEYQARAYGGVLIDTPVRPVWGMDTVSAGSGYAGSALVEWQYTDLPPEPEGTVPAGSPGHVPEPWTDQENLNPHTCPKSQDDAQAQALHFFETGEVIQTCPDGRCVASMAEDCR